MLRPYLKIWDWDLIFGRAVKGVRSPWSIQYRYMVVLKVICFSGSLLTVVELKAQGLKECKHILDILWRQPTKLVHVIPTSELHGKQRNFTNK